MGRVIAQVLLTVVLESLGPAGKGKPEEGGVWEQPTLPGQCGWVEMEPGMG